ncbi:hypothetical protein U1Q18_005883, partial [Sarracenia purpurea var. burkii]
MDQRKKAVTRQSKRHGASTSQGRNLNSTQEMKAIKAEIDHARSNPAGLDFHHNSELERKLGHAWSKEAEYLKQKSRINWLKHATNLISGIEKTSDSWANDTSE